jgi:hypothetical protein
MGCGGERYGGVEERGMGDKYGGVEGVGMGVWVWRREVWGC